MDSMKKDNNIQKEIYGNVKMLHPDGTFLCTVSKKRANYYINKQLAIWLNSDTFQLKFTPKGYGKSHIDYYKEHMENCCVVCGKKENLTRHHVFPYIFRSRLPIQYKESNHHDLLILCSHCHENYEFYATTFKEKIARDNGETISTTMTKEQKHNSKINSAKAVLNKIKLGLLSKDSIPQARLAELENCAKMEFYNIEKVGSTLWADRVVRNIIEQDGIFEFIKVWRAHFLEYAKPKFLPKHWSLNHCLEDSGQDKIV